MKLSKKRKCDGCRAFDGASCTLGFKNNFFKIGKFFHLFEYRPLEDCYKPLTNKDLKLVIELVEDKQIREGKLQKKKVKKI